MLKVSQLMQKSIEMLKSVDINEELREKAAIDVANNLRNVMVRMTWKDKKVVTFDGKVLGGKERLVPAHLYDGKRQTIFMMERVAVQSSDDEERTFRLETSIEVELVSEGKLLTIEHLVPNEVEIDDPLFKYIADDEQLRSHVLASFPECMKFTRT